MSNQGRVKARRGRRRRLAWAVMVCLALAWLACVSLWVRGYVVEDSVIWVTHRSGHSFETTLASGRGMIVVRVEHQTPRSRAQPIDPDGWTHSTWPAANSSIEVSEDGYRPAFGYERHFEYAMLLSAASPEFNDHLNHEDVTRSAWCRLWVPTAAPTIGLVLCGWRIYCGRRRAGTCPACGYDLRATPARCPECGRSVVEGTP